MRALVPAVLAGNLDNLSNSLPCCSHVIYMMQCWFKGTGAFFIIIFKGKFEDAVTVLSRYTQN